MTEIVVDSFDPPRVVKERKKGDDLEVGPVAAARRWPFSSTRAQ